MTTRHLKLPLALVLALSASHAHALGLGQMQVKSGLGQPLVAEIPILSATEAELENLNVRLASPDAFARVGLDRPLSLTANLEMQVVRDSRGQPVVRVSTPGRFNEPFLSFLVEADWGRGSLVREFTALVDPPYIAPAIIRPLQAPTVAAAPPPVQPFRPILPAPTQNPSTVVRRDEPVAAPEPVDVPEPAPAAVAAMPPPPMPSAAVRPPVPVEPEPEPIFEPSPFSEPMPELVAETAPAPTPQPPPPAPEPVPQVVAAPPPAPTPIRVPTPPPPAPIPAPEPAAPSDQYGPVKDGQTLWSVAEGLRPDTSITVNQMMLALQRANPGAFIDENVNRLKSGTVLRIPAREEAVAVLPDEAAALIRQQSGMRPIPQPEQSVAREPDPPPAVAAPVPAPVAKPVVSKPVAASPAKPRQARLEIVPPAGKSGARSTQSGASASGGGSELRAELSQTKEDLAAREAEVVELKSRLVDLEKLQTDSKSLIEMQNSELKALRDRLAEIEKQKQAVVAATPVPAPAPAVQSAAPTSETTDASPEQPVPESTTGQWYTHPGTIGGALLLLALMVWWLSRRGKAVTEPAAVSRRVSDDVALQGSLAKTAAAAESTQEPAVIAEDEDFEALGLQDMVDAHPKDMEARLNLLRHLHRKGDASAFEAAATDMRGQIGNTTDPRWREVVVMGMGLLPGHALFSQLGWNAPKFSGSSEAEVKPVAATIPAPEATPSWMRTTGPSQIADVLPDAPEASMAAVELEPAVADEIDLTPFNGDGRGADDIHRQEAELQTTDETSATKIELAKAYLDIGDIEGARAMLEDVLVEGGPEARILAASILKELG